MEPSRALYVHQRCHVNVGASRSRPRDAAVFLSSLGRLEAFISEGFKEPRRRPEFKCGGVQLAAHASRYGAPELRSPALIAPSLFLVGAFCCLFISLHLRQYESSKPEEPLWTLFTRHRHIVNDLEGLFLTLQKNP